MDTRVAMGGIGHGTLLILALGEMDREEAHFDMACPPLTTFTLKGLFMHKTTCSCISFGHHDKQLSFLIIFLNF